MAMDTIQQNITNCKDFECKINSEFLTSIDENLNELRLNLMAASTKIEQISYDVMKMQQYEQQKNSEPLYI